MKTAEKVDGSGSSAVENFLADLDHPMKAVIEQLRKLILGSDPKFTENIKWNAPNFCYGGEDRITLHLHRKGYLLAVFHRGAKAKAAAAPGRLIEDDSGLLEWAADDRATIKFIDLGDVLQNTDQLTRIIRLWIKAA